MPRISLSSAEIIVNNETIPIVPNSLMYDSGEGEINVRSANIGPKAVSIHSVNAETRIGKVKFDVFVLDNLDEQISQWKSRVGNNSIALVLENAVTKTFYGMSLLPSIERNVQSDGVVTLEFSGDPMVGG